MKLTVKLGGVASGQVAGLAALAASSSDDWVVVHGGGAEVGDWSRRLGLAPRTVDGLRVTDATTLEVVVAVLRGLINARLVAAFATAGRRAIGVSGVDGGLLDVVAEPELGFVGHVTGVDTTILERWAVDGLLPIVAPLAADAGGQLLNVNADEVAGAVAAARGGRLLLLTDVDGVERGGTRVDSLDLQAATAMLADGTAAGGMRPKLRAAITAAAAGCDVRILDGRSTDAVRAGLAGGSVGTRILAAAGAVPAGGHP